MTIFWCDDFEGNKLNPKWVSSRFSQGGQNDGVWSRDIKDSKLHWIGTGGGTETIFWGEYLSIPVNAPGDIIIEALVRQKNISASFGGLGVGFNQAVLTAETRYGCSLNIAGGVASVDRKGKNNTVDTPFPGFPSRNKVTMATSDLLTKFRIVRKNGYVFIYQNELFVGQYSYAPVITSIDMNAIWLTNQIGTDKFIDWIKITPSSVVL